MNFQAVEQANGNLVMMFGIFTEVGGVTYTQNQKAKCTCKITDDTGVKHTVHIYQGKGQLPSPQQAGTRSQFNISTFQGSGQRGSYTGYSGFWNSTAQVGQQARPPATQQPNSSKDVDWDAKDLRMARMNGLTNATKLICLLGEAGKLENPDVALITKTAELIVGYIYHGLPAATPNPAMSGDDFGPPPTEDDVPWED